MKPTLFALAVFLALVGAAESTSADDHIQIRLSVKLILRFDGLVPPSYDPQRLASAIAELNAQMEAHGRGYQLVLAEPVIPIGGSGLGRPRPSAHYSADTESERDEMESDALDNPGLYAWNPNAVNLYMNAGGVTVCGSPADELILLPTNSAQTAFGLAHAMGHFLNLCHVAGCNCNCCDPDETGPCHTTPGDDAIADTLPGLACWQQDEIAQHNFGLAYSQLLASQQNAVDNVYFNIMNGRTRCLGGLITPINRMTERQLDRWTDDASTPRRARACDGRTIFAQADFNGFQNGRSANPFRDIRDALSASTGDGDIILVRPGVYPVTVRIATPVTLRAPRGQTARIG